MNVTKNIINDLIPLYAVNECSGDTRALVEEYLRQNPQEAEELKRILTQAIPSAMPSADQLEEAQSLREARRRVRRRSFLMGLAIFFSLAPFSFLATEERTYWLFLEAPKTALVYGALGIGCWIAYAVGRKHSQLR